MIGENVQGVRKERKLSLRALSDLIQERGVVEGLSYSALQRIETGKRKVASHELAELAEVLSTSIASLIGSRNRSASLALATRVSTQPTDGDLGAVKTRIVEVLEAQDLLGRLVAPLPKLAHLNLPSVPASRAGGRRLAELVREKLQLGMAPIADLAALVEEALGALVFKEPLPVGTSGFCAIDDDAAVILINSEDPVGRQSFTLAHELCHLIMRDVDTLEVVGQAHNANGPKEGRADDFAAHFLAPDDALRVALGGSAAGAGDVVRLAHRFSMSLEAMANRLRNLGLLAQTADADLRLGHRRLAELNGLMADFRAGENSRGSRTPSGRLTDLALSAFAAEQVGIGLVAAVTGERDLDQLRTVLCEPGLAAPTDFEGAASLA
jgi:Zn-dependent peptidase ImmA (M78 family)/transcriptional regulator with XRE-family HTH domain